MLKSGSMGLAGDQVSVGGMGDWRLGGWLVVVSRET